MTASVRPIRVVIVDDHDLVRSGLSIFFETCDDLDLIGEASSGVEAVDLCTELKPDVVLMDLLMPDMDGVTATRIILENNPAIRVVALTSYQDEDLVRSAIQAGSISYVLKNVSTDELAAAIRDAYVGKSTLSPEAAQALVTAAKRPPEVEYDLTDREREVLTLMVQGLNNLAIADELVIARSTVKNHVSNILAKLNASSRTEAIAFAIQHNLVDKT